MMYDVRQKLCPEFFVTNVIQVTIGKWPGKNLLKQYNGKMETKTKN